MNNKRLLAAQAGAQIIEYSMLIAVLSLTLVLSMNAFRPPVCTLVANVSGMLGDAGGACPGAPASQDAQHSNRGRGDGNGNGNGKGNNGKGNGDTNGQGFGVSTP